MALVRLSYRAALGFPTSPADQPFIVKSGFLHCNPQENIHEQYQHRLRQ